MIGSLLIAGLLLSFPGSAEAAQPAATRSLVELTAEHQRVLDALNAKDADGRIMELDDPRVPGLVRTGWGLAGAWASAYIEAHPAASARELKRIFTDFAPKPKGVNSQYGDFLEYSEYSFEGRASRIAPSLYVVEASYGVEFATGTFMIVARGPNGHFGVLWDIKDLAEKHYAQRDELGRWMYLARRSYYNGPLNVAKIVPLLGAANGHPRFLVDAYQGAEGGTTPAQLSVWEWDGAAANPLLVESYEYVPGLKEFRFDGRTLRISTKERLRAFFSCGTCRDPQGVWTLRITPSGVEDLGHRFLQPEIQWADELLSKIDDGSDARQLADPKVLDSLKARKLTHNSNGALAWGMLDVCRVLRRGRRGGAFVLTVGEGSLHLTYELRQGRPYFTDVDIE